MHDAFVFPGLTQILLDTQSMFGQTIHLPPTRGGEPERLAGGEKLSHLGQCETFGMLLGDLHSPAVSPDPIRCLFRIILYWKPLQRSSCCTV